MITQGLEKLPTYHGSVYRGMIIKRKEFKRVFSGGVGIVVKQNRFVSSSNDMNVAFKFATKEQEKMRRNEVQFFIKVEGKTGVIFPKYQSLRVTSYLKTKRRYYS